MSLQLKIAGQNNSRSKDSGFIIFLLCSESKYFCIWDERYFIILFAQMNSLRLAGADEASLVVSTLWLVIWWLKSIAGSKGLISLYPGLLPIEQTSLFLTFSVVNPPEDKVKGSPLGPVSDGCFTVPTRHILPDCSLLQQHSAWWQSQHIPWTLKVVWTLEAVSRHEEEAGANTQIGSDLPASVMMSA